MDLLKQVDLCQNSTSAVISKHLIESTLGLPNKFLEHYRSETEFDVRQILVDYATPKIACQHLFGVSGKATIKAFRECTERNWKWASKLAYGDSDAVQKILNLIKLIPYEEDAVEFLLSIPMSARIRLLQATTFKYRGEVKPIDHNYIRDSGYLWKQIQDKDNLDLGRIRCWFSLHERLASAYVKELPDEALPINPKWEPLQGLSAIDGSWQLEFPTRVQTLKYWGQVLSNCVGGYGPAIKSGRSVIFVVRERGDITHCVEVCGEHTAYIQQFYGPRNTKPDPKIYDSVCDVLHSIGFVHHS